jgi:hypothetical protein
VVKPIDVARPAHGDPDQGDADHPKVVVTNVEQPVVIYLRLGKRLPVSTTDHANPRGRMLSTVMRDRK